MPEPRHPVAPRSVYLVTTAGHPNYGDELITASWLRQLADRAPDTDVWVDCPNPGPAVALLDGLHPKARFVDTLFRLCWEAPSEQPWDLAAWVQHTVNDPSRAPRWIAGIDILRDAQVLHVVGGGFINAVWPRHIGLLAGVVAAGRHSHGRTVLTGHSFVPAPPHTATLLASLTHDFDVLDVRDEQSAGLLRSAGTSHVQMSADDAFLAVHPNPPVSPTPSAQVAAAHPEFMLCLQSDMLEVDRAHLAAAVLRTLRAWQVDPANLGVVECIPRVDRDIYALLEHDLPGARFYPFTEVWRDGLPVEARQSWLSTRFHPHLLAAAAGASGIALPVSADYYRPKHDSLVALGSRWTLSSEWAPEGDRTPLEQPAEGGFPADVVLECHEQKLRLADHIYGTPASTDRLNRFRRPRRSSTIRG